jgi:hypothetical protein
MRAIKNIFFGYCCLITASEYAQNLVPNPSFETYTTCPTASSQIYYAVPWTGPTTNSTDYFNACSPTRGIPSVAGGYYQWPRTGNGYAVFWAAFNGVNYREYLQAPLTNSLISGNCYYIEFYTNLANYVDVAVNNIAAHLSDTVYNVNSTFPGAVLNLTPNALKFGNPIITDTLNWVKVSGIYTATGGEDHIIIGVFTDDAHTDSVHVVGYGGYYGGYYYIDDVSVISTDSMSLAPFAGNDTTIAIGDSVFIGRQLYGLNCNWYSNNVLIDTNISGIWVKPIATTKYVVEQNLCGNTGYDTVTVSISTVGIRKYADKMGISVYPNPANEKIFIEQAKNEEIIGVVVTDLYGKEVIKTSKQTEIDISSLAAGVYFIQVNTTNNTSTQKIIVQH